MTIYMRLLWMGILRKGDKTTPDWLIANCGVYSYNQASALFNALQEGRYMAYDRTSDTFTVLRDSPYTA
jgi:hypothetical protein